MTETHTDRAPRRTARLVGSAVGLTLASRVLGGLREAAIVGLVGVHPHTDAYFATSTVVVWLQNWAFGALSLYLVPRLLSLPGEGRSGWVRRLERLAGAFAVAAALLFVAAYGEIEFAFLGRPRVLGLFPAVLLAASIPVTVVSGIRYGVAVSTPRGILLAARALFLGNLVGVAALVLCAGPVRGGDWVLPLTLLVTQLATLLLLKVEYPAHEERPEQRGGSSQFVATTVENVGFNLNAIVQQGIAGRLGPGAVTLNAYAVRLVMVPLTGFLGPIQQRFLQHFVAQRTAEGLSLARRVVGWALLGATLVGVGIGVAVSVGTRWMPAAWAAQVTAFGFPWVLLAYGALAGVVFSNQLMARYYFAAGAGARYAAAMIAAYVAGTVLRAVLAGHLGLVAIPLASLIAEGGALALLVLGAGAARARPVAGAEPTA